MVRNGGVRNRPLSGLPIVIVDLETTGVRFGVDRIVEVAMRRFDPISQTSFAFDTLINPGRSVTSTQIHGIRSADVERAPTFEEMATPILDMMSGAVLASYNIVFDGRFLENEFDRIGVAFAPPRLCLMLMKPLLSLGPRRCLEDACKELGVGLPAISHIAASDALAAEGLLKLYLSVLREQGLSTYGDLAQQADYRFFATFDLAPLSSSAATISIPAGLISRSNWPAERCVIPNRAALRLYFDGLTAVLADHEITDEEESYMLRLQHRLNLTPEQLRALHARAFLCIMMNFVGDDWFDDEEVAQMKRVLTCLSKLGWSPCG